MMLKKKVMAAALGAVMFSGVASAVQVNPLGLGDLLVAPSYMIGGSWNTELKVINTDLVNSVVAKVVIHDAVTSGEVLDFLIYLSPGDVWNGTLSCADAACATQQMVSTDDSILQLNSTSFASATAPATYTTKTMSSIGYVTVIESSIYAVSPFKPGVAKSAILAAFTADPTTVYTDAQAATNTPDVLTGTATISNPVNGQSASIPMKALSGYNNKYKQIVGVDSSLGAPRSVATVADIEDALWVNNFAVPYAIDATSSSLVSITYPTKLTYRNVVSGQYPFASTVCVNTNVFDMSENTITGPSYNISPLPTSAPLCTPEHSWLTMGSGKSIDTGSFAMGWARINFATAPASVGQTSAAGVNTGKAGAPGIMTYVNTKGSQITWHYAPSN